MRTDTEQGAREGAAEQERGREREKETAKKRKGSSSGRIGTATCSGAVLCRTMSFLWTGTRREGEQQQESSTAAAVTAGEGRGPGGAQLRRREAEGVAAAAAATATTKNSGGGGGGGGGDIKEWRVSRGSAVSSPSPSSWSWSSASWSSASPATGEVKPTAARAAAATSVAAPTGGVLLVLLVAVSSCFASTAEAFVLPAPGGITTTTTAAAAAVSPRFYSSSSSFSTASGLRSRVRTTTPAPSSSACATTSMLLPQQQQQRQQHTAVSPAAAFGPSGRQTPGMVAVPIGRRGGVAAAVAAPSPAAGFSRSNTALSMVAGGMEAGVGAGRGGGVAGVAESLKVAVLALGSLLVSVQPAILVLATKAVVKLVASCGIGYFCSKKGILDQSAITSLSKLIFFVFQPCLLFVNVAATLGSPGQKLSKLLVLPVFAIFQILFGSAVGKGMEKLLGLKAGSPEARELRMCTSFANSGPLPLLFVDSIFGGHPDASIVSSAVAYISFYLLGWSPMFWTAGYTMVAGAPQPSAPISEADAQHFERLSPFRKLVVTIQRLKASPTCKRIASPPVLGCIAGMFVGLMPIGRTLLLGRTAPLSPVFDAIKGLGSAYLPAAMLVLAGSLARPSSAPMKAAAAAAAAAQGGDAGQEGEAAPVYKRETTGAFYKKIAAIMASRFLVMPLVAAVMLLTGAKAKLIPYDKLVWFVLLMEGCMPSAQNSVVILQMEKQPELASSMAKTLTAVYLLSAVPIAFLLSAILQFVQI